MTQDHPTQDHPTHDKTELHKQWARMLALCITGCAVTGVVMILAVAFLVASIGSIGYVIAASAAVGFAIFAACGFIWRKRLRAAGVL